MVLVLSFDSYDKENDFREITIEARLQDTWRGRDDRSMKIVLMTYLPYPDITFSLVALRPEHRLKQRKDALDIYNFLRLEKNLDLKICKMWEGYHNCLARYFNIVNSLCDQDGAPKMPDLDRGYEQQEGLYKLVFPPWWGNPKLHQSHRSNLIKLDKDYERWFSGTPKNLPLYWPST